VVTKEFQKQIDPLDIEDFKAVAITMVSLNAFMFFNSGYNSGASIMHKHMQVIPYQSMGSAGGLVPVEESALQYVKNNNLEGETFTLP
jgi:ATP adenylyltransferase